jgi:hypothetical protein
MVSEVVVNVIKLGSVFVAESFTTDTEVVAPVSGSVILGNGELVDVIRGAITLLKSDENTGTVFASISIVKIAEVVVTRSGRVPITFTMYVPAGFDYETVIFPVAELTLIWSVAANSCPSELSTPLYVQVFA